jgi:hypothetical protein
MACDRVVLRSLICPRDDVVQAILQMADYYKLMTMKRKISTDHS